MREKRERVCMLCEGRKGGERILMQKESVYKVAILNDPEFQHFQKMTHFMSLFKVRRYHVQGGKAKKSAPN